MSTDSNSTLVGSESSEQVFGGDRNRREEIVTVEIRSQLKQMLTRRRS